MAAPVQQVMPSKSAGSGSAGSGGAGSNGGKGSGGGMTAVVVVQSEE